MSRSTSLPIAAVRAGAVALICNLIISFSARSLAPGFMPLTAIPVSIWTVLGTLGAAITFALLRRWSPNPERTYLVVATIVLLISFYPDYLTLHTSTPAFRNATPAGAIVLMVMHVVVAACTVVFFRRVRPRSTPTSIASPVS